MSVRPPVIRGIVSVAIFAAAMGHAHAQSAAAWRPEWRTAADDQQSGQAVDAAQQQDQQTPAANQPRAPQLPDTSKPWRITGGGEAAGRIGVPGQEGQAGTQPASGTISRNQASALNPGAGSSRSPALDRASLFRPRSQQQEDEAADQKKLRRVVDAPDEDQLVPEFDQQTGAGFARRARRKGEEDPYAPLGIRAGAFVVSPSLELRGGHTVPDTGDNTSFVRVVPSVQIKSDWSRHELSARGSLQHEESDGDPSSDTQFDAGMALRLDVNRDTVARFDVAYTRDRVSPTDPDLPSTALEETSVDEWAFVGALSRRFGRFLATLTGTIADFSYGDTRVSGGGPPVDGSEQDYREYEAALRLDYEATDRVGVFAEAAINTRDYDRDISSGSLRLGSDGASVLGGLTFGGDGKLTGEAGIGYQIQSPDEPTYDDINAFLARGSLVWEATGLTTFTLTAETEIDDTVTGTSGGSAVYTFKAGVAHALRRNVTITAGVGAELQNSSSTISVEAGGEYKLNRSLAVVGDVVHKHSSDSSTSSDETTLTMGLRLQR
ncbi:MAG: outer membrane beta-barrel protein [Rhodobiaceae bacterium]|nr:outer membrane beta-barrel protein [Rhodobiaceae bacterium]MCC0013180.1 outer membrane beta-barrel protein [Rhodobiaceae bacterium]